LAVNKLDLITNQEEFINQSLWELQGKLNFAPWLPVIFISAKADENIKPLLDTIIKVFRNRQTQIPEEDLKEIVNFIKNSNSQLVKLKSIRQKSINPPAFDVRFETRRIPHESQIRYIENKIRDAYPMEGTPIYLDIVKR
jgi:GTP-binding protein